MICLDCCIKPCWYKLRRNLVHASVCWSGEIN